MVGKTILASLVQGQIATMRLQLPSGQWYAGEAKELLHRIQRANPKLFKDMDNAGMESDLLMKNWDTYAVTAESAKGQCIISIISTDLGKECQDQYMEDQIAAYAKSIEKVYGTMLDSAMMECINILHQGGDSALKRILAKTVKPYTADKIYASLCLDPADSTPNQVGDYTDRQKAVINMIYKYTENVEKKEDKPMANTTAINVLIKVAEAEVGYLEKKSNSQLDSKTANAGSANYTKYWRDIKPDYQGQPWCAAFVSWCIMKAFGLDIAKKLLKHWPYVYCPTMADLFTLNANPQVGDVVIFYRSGQFAHTGIVTKVSGDQFWTIEGNTSGGSTIIENGGGVCKKSYYNSNLPGTKFCRPDYSIVKASNTGSGTSTATTDTEKKQNTVAYVARITKDCKCYSKAGGSQAKLFPVLKKDAVVDVMKYTEIVNGKKWYFIRIPHPTEGFVFEFAPAGSFKKLD